MLETKLKTGAAGRLVVHACCLKTETNSVDSESPGKSPKVRGQWGSWGPADWGGPREPKSRRGAFSMKPGCQIRLQLHRRLIQRRRWFFFFRETHEDRVPQARRYRGGLDGTDAGHSKRSRPQSGCRCQDLRRYRVLMFNICVSFTCSFYLGNIQARK